METLQLLPVCFLLLAAFSVDAQTNFMNIRCIEPITAEIGKDITISCSNNDKIINSMVKFCTNLTLCPNSSAINTFRNIYTTDNGRITLKINITTITLHITSIRISDQGIYRFWIFSLNGDGPKNVFLEVIGPKTAVTETPIPETPVPETPILEKVKSEEFSYSAIILLPIVVLFAVLVAVAYKRRRKKKEGRQELSMKYLDLDTERETRTQHIIAIQKGS